MAEISEYEKQRLANIQRNREILMSLGLAKLSEDKELFNEEKPEGKKRKFVPRKKLVSTHVDLIGVRRSSRATKKPETYAGLDDEDGEGGSKKRRKIGDSSYSIPKVVRTYKPGDKSFATWDGVCFDKSNGPVFGNIETVPIGTIFAMRIDASHAGIHGPTVAGIHGAKDGCYSIAMNGGYDDNVDLGYAFTFTGEGGRDLKGTKSNPKNLRTAPQSKDQTLTKGNLALYKAVESKQPVRVIRGPKCNSKFAPLAGYRYDGLYEVKKAWSETGSSGFLVWRFALSRLPDQPPLPEREDLDKDGESDAEIEEGVESELNAIDTDEGKVERPVTTVSNNENEVPETNLKKKKGVVIAIKKPDAPSIQKENIAKRNCEEIHSPERTKTVSVESTDDAVVNAEE